jgi:putative transposase
MNRNRNFEVKTHCVFLLNYHVIFVSKFRKQIFSPEILEDLCSVLPEMAAGMGLTIIEINGEPEHLHFILRCSPQDCLGSVVGALKTKSASYLLGKYKFPYWGKHSRTIWSAGYFACSVGGAPLEVLKQYIQSQSGA